MLKFLTLFSLFYGLASGAGEKKLQVDHLALAQMEDGTPVPSDFQFASGETVFFSCRVSGYTKTGDDDPKIFVSYQVEARDRQGILVIPVETGKVASTLAPEDKNWQPKIRHTIALPPLADSGRYEIVVKVKDEFGKVETQAVTPLLVRGREVKPSDTLVVRNFRFLRAEDDRDPLQVAAYRPGEMVWARFDMTGYKIGEKNRFDVEYGLKVLRPSGDTTYEQARAAQEKEEAFYPQRYTPGILSLNLPKDLKTGEYTIVLTVRDNIGSQSYEQREKFSVE